VASAEDALLAHPAVPPDLGEIACARYFALQAQDDGRTLFENVEELLPAHVLVVGAQEARSWCHWEPDPDPRPSCRSDREYAERLHELLFESVRCRLRMVGLPAVMMSGGLDSMPAAVLAAPGSPGPAAHHLARL
jgi:asparagine synthetase B (glutamine-hydrolysing)